MLPVIPLAMIVPPEAAEPSTVGSTSWSFFQTTWVSWPAWVCELHRCGFPSRCRRGVTISGKSSARRSFSVSSRWMLAMLPLARPVSAANSAMNRAFA